MDVAEEKLKTLDSNKPVGLPPIYLLVGPPAVGKSTTSRLLAASFPKSIHIPVDDLRDMVVSGLVLPSPQWSDELAQQVSLARAGATDMALAYRTAGFTVVLDDFWEPNLPTDYQPLFAQPKVSKIILMPKQSAAHQRNAQRAGADPGKSYIDEGIQVAYRMLMEGLPEIEDGGWWVMDTSAMGVEVVVEEILNRTAR